MKTSALTRTMSLFALVLSLALPAAASPRGASGARQAAERERPARPDVRSPAADKPTPRAKAPPIRTKVTAKARAKLTRRPARPYYEDAATTAWTREHEKHMARLARLDRIEQIAAQRGDRKLQRRAQKLRGKELRRHRAEVQRLKKVRAASWHAKKGKQAKKPKKAKKSPAAKRALAKRSGR